MVADVSSEHLVEVRVRRFDAADLRLQTWSSINYIWLYFRCITSENNPVNKNIHGIWFALVQFKTADQMRPDAAAGNPGSGTAA